MSNLDFTNIRSKPGKTASMFLSNVSVIDHAFIDGQGLIQGRSYNPTFLVTGPVAGEEQVVVDFSNIKKTLKRLLDERYDHRVWIDADACDARVRWLTGEEICQVDTKALVAALPVSGVVAVPYAAEEDYLSDQLSRALSDFYEVELAVGVSLGQTVSSPWEGQGRCLTRMFNYCHGLRNSSSFGCRLQGHGHTSFFSAVLGPETDILESAGAVHEVLNEMVLAFSGKFYTTEANRLGTMSYGYNGYRGPQSITLKTPEAHGPYVVVFPEETTIENLATHIVRPFAERLVELGVEGFAVSEGLTKGAYVELRNLV